MDTKIIPTCVVNNFVRCSGDSKGRLIVMISYVSCSVGCGWCGQSFVDHLMLDVVIIDVRWMMLHILLADLVSVVQFAILMVGCLFIDHHMMIISLMLESLTSRRELWSTKRVKLWAVVLIGIVRVGIFNVSLMVNHSLIVVGMLKEIDWGWIGNECTILVHNLLVVLG